jgi:hypothetical protein
MGVIASRRSFFRATVAAALLPSASPRIAFLGTGPMARARGAGSVCQNPREFPAILSDPRIDAVCIGGPVSSRARWTVAACQGGKDVYVEAPCCLSTDEAAVMVRAARKHGRIVQIGTVDRSGLLYRTARRMVRSGELGEIAYCRIGAPESLDLIGYIFDDQGPPVAARSPLSYRYPGFVVACEGGESGASFHGARATLRVDRNACRIFPGGTVHAVSRDDDPARQHWNNWLASIRTRTLPVSDIATSVYNRRHGDRMGS